MNLMKALKITFAMLSLVVLTVSGTSSDTVTLEEHAGATKTSYDYDLMAHTKTERGVVKAG